MKKINKYLMSLLLIVILITGCNNKEIDNNTDVNNNEINNNVVVNNKQELENDSVVLEKKGHTLNSTIGNIIVDKDGSVYYEPYENINYLGSKYKLTTEDLSVLGTKQQCKNYTYQSDPLCNIDEGCTVEVYKLDLTNISSAYEVSFGNGGSLLGITFVSYDGKVHELKILLGITKSEIKLNKNISKYPNIVSVVPNMQFGGHGAIIIDKNGNKYEYSEATE